MGKVSIPSNRGNVSDALQIAGKGDHTQVSIPSNRGNVSDNKKSDFIVTIRSSLSAFVSIPSNRGNVSDTRENRLR